MKYYLFLLSVLSVVYLTKAGPLRLQKRAAFYIANETACVVDNIVYSSGDPIPTDDPCEACKCRPPGFACVLKECKVKPGCRAVRHVGHCCPEYICDNPETTSVIGDNVLPPANLLPELYESGLPGVFPATEVAETAEPSQTSTTRSEPSESTDISVATETISSDSGIEEKSPEDEINIEEIPGEKEKQEDNSENKAEKPQVLFNSEVEIKKEDEIQVTTVKEVIEDDKSTESTSRSTEVITEAAHEGRDEEPIIAIENDKVIESEAEETTEHVEISVTSTIAPGTETSVKNSAAQNSKSLKLLEDQTSEELVEKIELIKEKAATSQNTGEESEAVTSVSAEEQPEKVKIDDTTVSTKSEVVVEENVAEESSNDHQSIAFYSNDDKVIKKESAETVTIVVHVREKSKPPTETDFVTEEKVTEVYSPSEQPEGVLVKSNDNIKAEIHAERTGDEEVTSTGKNFEIFPDSTEINRSEFTTSSSKDPEEKIEARSEPDSQDLDSAEKTSNEHESDSKSNVDQLSTGTTPIVSKEVAEISNEAREGEIDEEAKENEIPKVTEIPKEEPKVTVEEQKVTEIPKEEPKITEIVEEQKVTEKPQNELKVTKITVEQPNITLKINIITDSEETSKVEVTEAKSEKGVTDETKLDADESVSEEIELKSEDKIEEAKQKIAEKVEEPKLGALEVVKTDESLEVKPEERSLEDEPEEKVEVSKPEVEESKSEENVEESKPEENVEESKPEGKVEESKTEEKVEESKPEEKIEEEKAVEAKQEENIEKAKQEERVKETIDGSENSEEKQEVQKPKEEKDQESAESNQSEKLKDGE